MSDNHNNKIEQLLTHDGITPEVGLELEKKILVAIETKRREARRLRVAVLAGAWLLLLGLMISAEVLKAYAEHSVTTRVVCLAAQVGLAFALFLTISWHMRNVSLRFTKMSDTLAEVQNQLSEISRRARTWLPFVVCI